jgi:hypothetical protein
LMDIPVIPLVADAATRASMLNWWCEKKCERQFSRNVAHGARCRGPL